VTPHPLIAATSAVGPSTYWYATRATGIVALLLLTLSLVLGVVDVSRFSSERYPRFLIDGVHRTVSLLAVAFLLVHIIASVLDSFAPISLIDGFVPFVGSYRPFWLGLGAVSFDLMLAVVITSLVRGRLGYRAWRAVHWLGYASWPVALLHGLGTGSDTHQRWVLILNALCVIAVIVAVLYRALGASSLTAGLRTASIVGSAAFVLALIVWTENDPLAKGWARRSGTPSSLLAKPVAR
jgi:methionine sulfoxide reductase heme-binding subunit